MKPEYSWRFMLVGSLLLVLPVLVLFQLVRLQTDSEQKEKLLKQGDKWTSVDTKIVPPRGLIYDRWGHLLAGNQIVYEVGVELDQVTNANAIALATSLVLNEDYAKMFGLISTPLSKTAKHITLADNVSQEQVDKLKAMKEEFIKQYGNIKDAPSLDGLTYIAHLQRTYPEKSLASNILGFVNRDGVGFYGVEAKYNEWLAGKAKEFTWSNDLVDVKLLPDVPEGASLVLTIDRAIQSSMEELVDKAVDETGSKSGTIVVLEPKTGEVMAMATSLRMDVNEYWHVPEIYTDGIPFNRVVSEMYEPGSVYKVLTMAAGLDSGAVKPETEFLDRGVIEIGGAIIYNWDGGAWGPQDMQGCMQHSLNVCLAWIAKRMGTSTFYDYMERFGIGHLTGIDLAGEAAGRLKMPGDSDWYEADLATNSFGQGVSATPLQMAAAVSAVANDGKIMAPHVVRSIISKGYQKDIEQRVVSTPISAETAHTLTEMLARSLEIESSDALVPGYRVAGKTGTAEIPTPYGYTSDLTNASFVGWGPVDDPRFVIYIWLEKPQASVWGSIVAAPVFSEAVQRLVVLLDLPPDEVRQQLLGQ